MADDIPLTLTIAEAAYHLRIQPDTLANRISAHRKGHRVSVPPYRTLSGRHTLIPRQQFVEWLSAEIAGGHVSANGKRRPGRPTKAEQRARQQAGRE